MPFMAHNPLPPFALREAGLLMNTTLKIQAGDPTAANHFIYFKRGGFRIPLFLSGVFFYFSHVKPSLLVAESTDEVYMLTPKQ